MSEISRRGFLKILTASIAAPIIVRAAFIPQLIVPGIQRVEAVTRAELMVGDARFANAAFTPGGEIRAIRDAMRINVCRHLPKGTQYQVRALEMSAGELSQQLRGSMRHGYSRSGWAVMWVTDADLQRGLPTHLSGSELIGTYAAGDAA